MRQFLLGVAQVLKHLVALFPDPPVYSTVVSFASFAVVRWSHIWHTLSARFEANAAIHRRLLRRLLFVNSVLLGALTIFVAENSSSYDRHSIRVGGAIENWSGREKWVMSIGCALFQVPSSS